MGPELCRFLSDSSGGGPRAHTGNGLPLGPVRSSGAWGRVGVEAVGAGGSPGRYPPPPRQPEETAMYHGCGHLACPLEGLPPGQTEEAAGGPSVNIL